MFTRENYTEEIERIDISKLPVILMEFYTPITEMIDDIGLDVLLEDETGAVVFDNFIKALNSYVEKNQDIIIKQKKVVKKYNNKIVLSEILKKLMPKEQQLYLAELDSEGVKELSQVIDDLEKQIKYLLTNPNNQNDGYLQKVLLHYFVNGSDWFIIDYDKEENLLFGFAIINGDYQNSEFGYISPEELINIKTVQLDYYWDEKTTLLKALKNTSDYYNYLDKEEEKEEEKQQEQKSDPHSDKVNKKEEKQPKEDNRVVVNSIGWDIVLIKSFIAFNGKEKTQKQVLSLITKIEKAISDQRINRALRYGEYKKTESGKIVVEVLSDLKKIYGAMGDTITLSIDNKDIEIYNKIINSEKISDFKICVNSYIKLQGKSMIYKQAKTLIKKISSLDSFIIDDVNKLKEKGFVHENTISKEMHNNLNSYINKYDKAQEGYKHSLILDFIDFTPTNFKGIKTVEYYKETYNNEKPVLDNDSVKKVVVHYKNLHNFSFRASSEISILQSILKEAIKEQKTSNEPILHHIIKELNKIIKHYGGKKFDFILDKKDRKVISEFERKNRINKTSIVKKIIINNQDKKKNNSLKGITPSCSCNAVNGIINSNELLNMDFDLMNFTGDFKNLIGNPSNPFHAMIYAKAGRGKSTLALLLSKYLSEQHNKKVLYVTKDEGLSYTFKEKIQRLNVYNENISISKELPEDISNFDVVVLDLMNDFQIYLHLGFKHI